MFPSGRLELYLADALRNVLLFAPLGAGLAWLRMRAGWMLLLGIALSAAVEAGQTLIPSRNGSLLDVAFNTAGTVLGYAVARALPLAIDPPATRERRLVLVSAVVAASLFTATAIGFEPSLRSERLYLHFTPKFSYRYHYDGRIEAVRLDGLPIPRRPYLDAKPLEDRFERDFRLDLDLVAAPPPERQAPIFLMSQETGLHVLELAADGEDLVFQYRTVGKRIGLEPARLQWRGILAGVPPGRRISLGVERRGRDLCLRVDAEERCGLGFSLGDGWQLFGLPVPLLAPLRAWTGAAWVALLCAPLGYWARREARTGLALAIAGAALVLAPLPSSLFPTPALQLAGAGLGVVAGLGLRRAAVAARRAVAPPRER